MKMLINNDKKENLQSIIESLEKQRIKIGCEIHDELSPILSLIRLTIDSVYDEAESKNYIDLLERLEQIRNNVDIVTENLRNLSHTLVPKLLEEFGLRISINDFVIRIQNTKKINIQFYTNLDNNTRFSQIIETHLFRCCQELINNTLKHAQANNVLIQLIQHKNSLVYSIEDDGRGFDINSIDKSKGLGLRNIESYAKLLNGILIIDSTPNMGTLITIEVEL